jgi:hypothetical protein
MPPSFDYRHVPTVSAFNDSNAFIRGLMGPLGGGKSSGCVWEIAQRGLQQKPGPDGVRRTRWPVIRQSYRQLEDSTIGTFLQWFPPYRFGTWSPSTHTYRFKALRAPGDDCAADIEVRFRALDRPDQIGNLLSTEYTGAWVNEARDIEWAVIDALVGRVGRYPAMRDGGPTWFGIFMDTNPPDTDSDWYRFFEDQDHSESIAALNKALRSLGHTLQYTVDSYRAIFKQPSGLGELAENLPNLPPGYYQRQMVGKSDDWIKVYLKGEYGFTLDGKPVFPEYADNVHCPQDEKEWPRVLQSEPVYIDFDFGLTPAAVWGQLTPSGRWFVFDEMVATDMGFDEFSDMVLEHNEREYRGIVFDYGGDPAGMQRAQTDEKTCFQIAAAKGIRIEPAPQTLQIRLEGARKPMRTMVGGKPQLIVHPNCRRLRKALSGGYHYRRVQIAGERYEEKPFKGPSSHVADAFTYQGARLFGRSLRERRMEEALGDSRAMADMTRSAVTGY